VVPVLFALLTSLCNGTASVFQRMAASTAPAAKALHLSLFSYLIRRKIWLAGIGMVILAAVCQAIALDTGPIALVQPIFIIELPFTLLVASVFIGHRRLPRLTWWAVGLVTVGLGAGLAIAAPSGGTTHASLKIWVTTLIVTGGFETVVIAFGVRAKGNARAAAFGLAAACGYSLTAVLLKSAVATLSQGVVPFFESWQLYGTAGAGVGALFLLQNGLQAGSLVAVQPPLTLGDALISVSYGVTVYNENVRTGGWLLVGELAALIAVAIGCLQLSRSLAEVHVPQPAPPPVSPPRNDAVNPHLPTGLVLAAACWLAACAVPLAVIDVAVRRLPDRLTIPAYAGTAALLLAAAAVSGHWPSLLRAALGGLALAGFYLALLLISPSAMGLGDVKLAASLGTLLAWFGWRTLIAGGFAGFALAGLFAVALLVSRRATRKQHIPFGPFMILGAFLVILL
jgi:prepilin signal peptidase PulO-like enzyme (type II secretory pathway)